MVARRVVNTFELAPTRTNTFSSPLLINLFRKPEQSNNQTKSKLNKELKCNRMLK